MPASSANEGVLLQAMQQAWAWYSTKQWGQAEQACRLVLAARPHHFDALNLLGIIAAQTGRAAEAVPLPLSPRKLIPATVVMLPSAFGVSRPAVTSSVTVPVLPLVLSVTPV